MPKNLSEKEKIDDLKKFIKSTWKVVRRSPEYRSDYLKFLQNYDKEKLNPDMTCIFPPDPKRRAYYLDLQKGRYMPQEGTEPDPQRCNLPFMIKKWGFACDPDESTPQNAFWNTALISKKWRKWMKAGKLPSFQPLSVAETQLQKLPGVLEVIKLPEIKIDHQEVEPIYHEEKKVMEVPNLIWQTPENFDLTVKINLQAPSNLIHYALEILVKVCKAELQISDGQIDHNHIQKCLTAWDLEQRGMDKRDIADKIPVRRYETREGRSHGERTPEMIIADQEITSDTAYESNRISEYLNKAWAMIKRGSII